MGAMFLKELQIGKRFMFDDKKTPLALALPARGQVSAHGTWLYVRVGENACPVIKRVDGPEITLVSYTYLRSVLIIIEG